jgi:hypothetical protein
MKIQIEDYRGNDICSFKINSFANDDGIADIGDFIDCNYADMDEDENGDLYIRVQLEKEDFTNNNN